MEVKPPPTSSEAPSTHLVWCGCTHWHPALPRCPAPHSPEFTEAGDVGERGQPTVLLGLGSSDPPQRLSRPAAGLRSAANAGSCRAGLAGRDTGFFGVPQALFMTQVGSLLSALPLCAQPGSEPSRGSHGPSRGGQPRWVLVTCPTGQHPEQTSRVIVYGKAQHPRGGSLLFAMETGVARGLINRESNIGKI